MKIAVKIHELFNRFIEPVTNKNKGVHLYGTDDLLPNGNLRLINDCGVAKRAVSKKAMYIQGDGFADKEKSKVPVNPDQTADDLLSEISSYVSMFDGFALQIRRKGDTSIADIKAIPFECVRKKIDGSLTYNPLKGLRDYKESDTTVHPPYDPKMTPEKMAANIKKYGDKPEIAYAYHRTADHPFYPAPDYYAGVEDIKTCIEISKMDYESVMNGFMPSAILVTQEIDQNNKDDQGKSPYDHFSDELKKFSGQEKTTGTGGRFKLMHIMVSSMEEAPDLKPFDAKVILEAANTKRDVISREVCRLFGVHPVLAGFSDAQILGNTQAISNAITELNNTINPLQRMISAEFGKLFNEPSDNWTITQFNPITYIPDQVWDTLTVDEKRSIAGFDPLPIKIKQPSKNGVSTEN